MNSAPVAGSSRQIIRLASYLLAVAGLLALGYCLAVFLDAKFFEARESRNFAVELRRDAAAAARHSGSPIPVLPPPIAPRDGAVVGELQIPRIGVSVMIVEGVDGSDLKRAAGHIPGTPLPGESGNVGIAAHRDTFFRPLRSIERNDVIVVSTLQGAYRYRVVSTKIVKPEDVQVLYPTGRDTLTLVTCFPFAFIGSAPKRFIVRADGLPGE